MLSRTPNVIFGLILSIEDIMPRKHGRTAKFVTVQLLLGELGMPRELLMTVFGIAALVTCASQSRAGA